MKKLLLEFLKQTTTFYYNYLLYICKDSYLPFSRFLNSPYEKKTNNWSANYHPHGLIHSIDPQILMNPKSSACTDPTDRPKSRKHTFVFLIVSSKTIYSASCRMVIYSSRSILVMVAMISNCLVRWDDERMHCFSKRQIVMTARIVPKKRRIIWQILIYVVALSRFGSRSF